MKLRDTGTEIGFACARVFALSTISLVGTTMIAGIVSLAGDFPLIEAPIHRVAKTSAGLMGLSMAGCFLGAWMTGAIGKDEAEESKLSEVETLNREWRQKYELARDFSQAEIEMGRSAIEARDNEISRFLREIHKLTLKLYEWERWMETCESVGEKYDVFGCKDCQHFVGSGDGGNFFVCAMHPYGKRNCRDKV